MLRKKSKTKSRTKSKDKSRNKSKEKSRVKSTEKSRLPSQQREQRVKEDKPEEVKRPKEPSTKEDDETQIVVEKQAKGGGESTRTVFEKVSANSRPAVCREKQAKMKWKSQEKPGKKTSKKQKKKRGDKLSTSDKEMEKTTGTTEEEVTKEEEKPPQQINKADDKDFSTACGIMVQIRQSNLLETALTREENEFLKKFFEKKMENPTPKVIGLLQIAMELCYERIMRRSDEYDILLDAKMMEFMKNKVNAKCKLLDVLLGVPDMLPLMWGGKNVGLKITGDKDNAEMMVLEMEKSTMKLKEKPEPEESPWTKMMREAAGTRPEVNEVKTTREAPVQDEPEKSKVQAIQMQSNSTMQPPAAPKKDISCYFSLPPM